MEIYSRKILNIAEHLVFAACLAAVLYICITRAMDYYANGQAIASAHLDGHFSAVFLNFLLAIVISITVALIYRAKKWRGALKWFAIPVVFIAFAGVHRHIGSLFYCCPPI